MLNNTQKNLLGKGAIVWPNHLTALLHTCSRDFFPIVDKWYLLFLRLIPFKFCANYLKKVLKLAVTGTG